MADDPSKSSYHLQDDIDNFAVLRWPLKMSADALRRLIAMANALSASAWADLPQHGVDPEQTDPGDKRA